MKKSNNPCLTNTEALKEVANRTGLPINAVLQAICSYHDREVWKEMAFDRIRNCNR